MNAHHLIRRYHFATEGINAMVVPKTYGDLLSVNVSVLEYISRIYERILFSVEREIVKPFEDPAKFCVK